MLVLAKVEYLRDLQTSDVTLKHVVSEWRALLAAGVVGVSLVSWVLWKWISSKQGLRLEAVPVKGRLVDAEDKVVQISETMSEKSEEQSAHSEDEYEVDQMVDAMVRFLTQSESVYSRKSKKRGYHKATAMREEELEQIILSRKAPSCGFAEILMPTGQQPRREGLLVKSNIQRYRVQDLQENALENQKTVERLKSILKEQEAAYFRLIQEKDGLIAQSIEEEAIRTEAEATARVMQVQIDALRQGLQDYNMQTNNCVSQLKQLNLELRLIEIMNGDEKSRLIQDILNDMKAEINREEGDLVGLCEINEKLRKEAEQDEARRFKYEQELKQLEEQIEFEQYVAKHMDSESEYSFDDDHLQDKIFGFSDPVKSLRASTQLRSSKQKGNTSRSDDSWSA